MILHLEADSVFAWKLIILPALDRLLRPWTTSFHLDCDIVIVTWTIILPLDYISITIVYNIYRHVTAFV